MSARFVARFDRNSAYAGPVYPKDRSSPLFDSDLEKMKIKKRWLLVILIASVQLVLLLAGVMFGANWFEQRFVDIVEQQASSSNQTILHRLEAKIQSARVSQLSIADTGNPLLKEVFLSEQVPNNGFLALIELESGKVLFNANHPRPLTFNVSDGVSLPDYSNKKLNIENKTTGVVDFIQSDERTVYGFGNFENESYLVSCRKVQGTNVGLLAAQKQSIYSTPITNLSRLLRNVGFGATLLIGLICTSLMVSVLQRYDNTQSSHNAKLEEEVSKRSRSLMRTKNAVIFGLAKIAESRDTDTGEHLDRIGKYVTILADQLRDIYPGINDKFIADLALASSLHDIGKVGIPDSILLKPGRLTSDERFVMEQHTVIGGECLEAIESQLGEDTFLEMARNIAYAHHERWDGKGYPYKLSGEDIPLAARITSVADVYDALTTKRPYKKAMSHEESRKIIVSGLETQFDPFVVEAFIAREDDFQVIAANQSDNQIPALLSLENIVAIQSSSVTADAVVG